MLTFFTALLPPQQVVLSQDPPVPAGLGGLQQVSGVQEGQHVQGELRAGPRTRTLEPVLGFKVNRRSGSAAVPLWAAAIWSLSGTGARWSASGAWPDPTRSGRRARPEPGASQDRSTPAGAQRRWTFTCAGVPLLHVFICTFLLPTFKLLQQTLSHFSCSWIKTFSHFRRYLLRL